MVTQTAFGERRLDGRRRAGGRPTAGRQPPVEVQPCAGDATGLSPMTRSCRLKCEEPGLGTGRLSGGPKGGRRRPPRCGRGGGNRSQAAGRAGAKAPRQAGPRDVFENMQDFWGAQAEMGREARWSQVVKSTPKPTGFSGYAQMFCPYQKIMRPSKILCGARSPG